MRGPESDDELERLLSQEAPNAKGKTWVALIAEALLRQARKGDVRAIAEPANRIEGNPLQAVDLGGDLSAELLEGLAEGRKRVAEWRARECAALRSSHPCRS